MRVWTSVRYRGVPRVGSTRVVLEGVIWYPAEVESGLAVLRLILRFLEARALPGLRARTSLISYY